MMMRTILGKATLLAIIGLCFTVPAVADNFFYLDTVSFYNAAASVSGSGFLPAIYDPPYSQDPTIVTSASIDGAPWASVSVNALTGTMGTMAKGPEHNYVRSDGFMDSREYMISGPAGQTTTLRLNFTLQGSLNAVGVLDGNNQTRVTLLGQVNSSGFVTIRDLSSLTPYKTQEEGEGIYLSLLYDEIKLSPTSYYNTGSNGIACYLAFEDVPVGKPFNLTLNMDSTAEGIGAYSDFSNTLHIGLLDDENKYSKAFQLANGFSIAPYTEASAVPIPAAVWLLGSGLLGLLGLRRKFLG